MLVLEGLVGLHRTIQLQLLQHYCWGTDLDYCDIEWFVLEINRDYSVIFKITFKYWWLSWLRICLQCRRPRFDPWVGKIPWRRERLPTPVFWPGEFMDCIGHGSQRLSDFHFSLSCIGEGNGNLLQCSCLENPGMGESGGLLSMGSHRVGHD